MQLNYFAVVCFVWALIGLCSRALIRALGARWRDWEENKAYPDKRPGWLLPADLLAVALIAFTWYKAATGGVKGGWILAALMTLLLLKAMLQLFQYDQFKAFVKKAMRDERLFAKINAAVLVFSVCLIGLGIFYGL